MEAQRRIRQTPVAVVLAQEHGTHHGRWVRQCRRVCRELEPQVDYGVGGGADARAELVYDGDAVADEGVGQGIGGEDVIDATPPGLRQMIEVFERVKGPVLAVERVPAEDVSNYGVVAFDASQSLGRGVYRITDLVEKPRREDAPSNLAIIGRYILTPDIFPALKATVVDRTGEIQLTNGLRRLLQDRPIYACEVKGVRHDTGNKLGFLKAVVYFALRRPDLAEPFRKYLRENAGI